MNFVAKPQVKIRKSNQNTEIVLDTLKIISPSAQVYRTSYAYLCGQSTAAQPRGDATAAAPDAG